MNTIESLQILNIPLSLPPRATLIPSAKDEQVHTESHRTTESEALISNIPTALSEQTYQGMT